MSSYQTFDLNRSITSKQIVAITGLLLILYVIVHLAGNLFIFAGPQAFNGYADKLGGLGPIKTMAEWILFFIFLIHIVAVTYLVTQNIKARGMTRYAVDNSKRPRSLATRLMPYSGTYLIVYLIWHLVDFTWANHHGNHSLMYGQDYGLYGLVINTFKDPMHSWMYVLAMCFLGLHLAHGVQSFIQTFGFNDSRFTLGVRKFSNLFALAMVIAYSSIPLYVLYVLKI